MTSIRILELGRLWARGRNRSHFPSYVTSYTTFKFFEFTAFTPLVLQVLFAFKSNFGFARHEDRRFLKKLKMAVKVGNIKARGASKETNEASRQTKLDLLSLRRRPCWSKKGLCRPASYVSVCCIREMPCLQKRGIHIICDLLCSKRTSKPLKFMLLVQLVIISNFFIFNWDIKHKHFTYYWDTKWGFNACIH